MTRPLTVLIVGGYGTFGGRLAHLLSDLPGLTLLIGGRSLTRAEEFCSQQATASATAPRLTPFNALNRLNLPSRPAIEGVLARLCPVQFDRNGDPSTQLRALAPDIVVDASGPFQSYGEQPYRLVEACIECGVHYLDLADSAEFVCRISRFDESARARGVFVLSGVSSFPVLTAAVVRLLSVDMARVEAISAGIAPSPFANVGLNVIRAIAGYAGKPVRLRDGRASGDHSRVGYALTETVRYTIAAPGRLPLHSIQFSLVDVPDLRLLADLWPECRSVWMGAGPTPAVLHWLLRALAWLVRLRLMPSLSWLATTMHRAIDVLRWGEHRGGMFVRVSGVDGAGFHLERSWHLVAEGDAGPFIPSMACEAIIRKGLGLMGSSAPTDMTTGAAGSWPTPGARAALRELEVSDYVPLLVRRSITFGVHDDTPSTFDAVPLYQRIAGAAWHSLPPAIRAMHSLTHGSTLPAARRLRASLSSSSSATTAVGRADITRGTTLLSRLAASIVGFPQAGKDIPVIVRFEVSRSRETWTRTFASRSFSSEQFPGTGRFDRLLCERFGPITLALAVVVDNAQLRLIVRGWTFLGIPLPRSLAPQCDAHESQSGGFFHFDVAISHRWTGLIVHYRGWLVPHARSSQAQSIAPI